MAWLLTTLFRWVLWFLLTSDASVLNLGIGLVVAALLPRSRQGRRSRSGFLRALLGALVAVPQAYLEAAALLGASGEQEQWLEQPSHSRGDALVMFLEVLAITLTPFTLVLGLSSADGSPVYRVHSLRPQRPSPIAGGRP
ncbi:MAG: sodium:proton antiporter [Cyanobacteriota bacterium]|nr:sodium:proton antiporter [Cyanobacteriota bacterium]